MERLTLPPTSLRVAFSTAPAVNEHIRAMADAEVLRLEAAAEPELSKRLGELDQEWDIERTLQVNASILVLTGTALGVMVDKRFLALPALVFTFLAQHALQGWCPPVPVFRRLGVRTQREIDRERFAVKALRGDFDTLPSAEARPAHRIKSILKAVDR